MNRISPGRYGVALLLLLLIGALFGRALFLGEAFLPVDQLAYIAPWHRSAPDVPWNVLRFDGITQFYPWRLEAARQILSGHLPLGNPYAFSGEGGTPLLANSQSAPLYPLNAIYWLLGPQRIWYGFGLSAAIHLLLLTLGTYRFGRALGLDRTPAAFSAIALGLSAPVTAWQSLPTYLAAITWLPWLLLAIRRERPLRAAVFVGLTLLSGHLQLAAYVLLAAGFYTGLHLTRHRGRVPVARGVAVAAACCVLGACLAAPQVAPAIELGRSSHRGGVAATAPGYSAYQANAIPLRHLVTLAAPDFYGNPQRNHGLAWSVNRDGLLNNFAEWALYFGVAPLLAAVTALFLPWKRTDTGLLRERRDLAALVGAASLMAFGSPVNAVFYYLVPGFAATGNPGRVGIVAVFALCLLAGVGLQIATRKAALVATGATIVVCAICAAEALQFGQGRGLLVGELVGLAMPGIQLAVVLILLGALSLWVMDRLAGERRIALQSGLVALTALELFNWGRGYNPTGPAADAFPETPGIAFLRSQPGRPKIACLNGTWSLSPEGPGMPHPVLPPNALTVFRLHDIGGYDSLFLRSTKEQISDATGGEPSPAENGNLVFVKTIEAARKLGAKYLVMPPVDRTPSDPDLNLRYRGDDLMIFESPTGEDAPPTRDFATPALRVGLFLGCFGLAALATAVGSGSTGRRRRS